MDVLWGPFSYQGLGIIAGRQAITKAIRSIGQISQTVTIMACSASSPGLEYRQTEKGRA